MNALPTRTLLFFILILLSPLVICQAPIVATPYIVDAIVDGYRMERDCLVPSERTILSEEVRAEIDSRPDSELPRHIWNAVVQHDPGPRDVMGRSIERVPAHIMPANFALSPNLAPPDVDLGAVVERLAWKFAIVSDSGAKGMSADTRQAFLQYKESCIASLKLAQNSNIMHLVGMDEWIKASTIPPDLVRLRDENGMTLVRPMPIKLPVTVVDAQGRNPRVGYQIVGDYAAVEFVEQNATKFPGGVMPEAQVWDIKNEYLDWDLRIVQETKKHLVERGRSFDGIRKAITYLTALRLGCEMILK